MNIETKDIIKLSDGKSYVVVSKTKHKDNYFLYLIDTSNDINIKFVMEKHEDKRIKLIEINDDLLLEELLPLFINNTKDVVNNILNDIN